MSGLWDSVKAAAGAAGVAAKLATRKTKLRTEIALVDREINARKHRFGVEMYDHCAPLMESQDFYAADDMLTNTLRPPLIAAQKEIAALEGKRKNFKQILSDKETKRAGAFPTPASTLGEKVMNAGKTTAMMGSEAKTKTDVAVMERQILAIKQQFGLELFDILVGLEDTQGWLPPDRNVRAIYDQTRRDIDDIIKKKEQKKQKLKELSGGGGGSTGGEIGSSHTALSSKNSLQVAYRAEQPELNQRRGIADYGSSREPSRYSQQSIQAGNSPPTVLAPASNPPPMKDEDLLMFDYDD